jgi:hypothetical protein
LYRPKWSELNLRPRATAAASAGLLVVLALTGLTSTAAQAAPPAATHAGNPDKPSGLKTLPSTACSGSTVGDADVKLYATVSSQTGGLLDENYSIWKAGHPATRETGTLTSVASGSGSSPFVVTKAWLEASSGGVEALFEWHVTATQNGRTSRASTTCSFTFDPTRPTQAPTLTPPTAATIGVPVTISAGYPPAGAGDTIPASYEYQLNSGPPGQVTADARGNATITVTPTRNTNILVVTAVSKGGNFPLKTGTLVFVAAPAAPRVDADLTSDGNPDLVTIGGVHGLPPGVWLAEGTSSGHPSIDPAATNIGADGEDTGPNGLPDNPGDLTGGQVITGHFFGTGTQDILYYYPANGSGGVISYADDGSVLNPLVSGNSASISADSLCDFDWDTFSCVGNPVQLVNAGEISEDRTGIPDLIGVFGDHLAYYHGFGPGGYGTPVDLTTPTPDGTMDWDQWTLATAQSASGATDVFLWNKATGALDLWSDLVATTGENGDVALTFTASTLADGTTTVFEKGKDVTLDAADVNHDGTPDLWTVADGGVVDTWLNSNGTVVDEGSQTLVTAARN